MGGYDGSGSSDSVVVGVVVVVVVVVVVDEDVAFIISGFCVGVSSDNCLIKFQ